MKNLFILILSCIIFVSCKSEKQYEKVVKPNIEDCDWISSYHWIKKTFEENDAGFSGLSKKRE